MLAAFDQLARLRRFGQRASSFCRSLQHLGDIVDRQLHLFVIALVGLGDQFVDLALEIWARMRLPSPMGSRIASSIALTPRTISA